MKNTALTYRRMKNISIENRGGGLWTFKTYIAPKRKSAILASFIIDENTRHLIETLKTHRFLRPGQSQSI
jgi:hypothetical protein